MGSSMGAKGMPRRVGAAMANSKLLRLALLLACVAATFYTTRQLSTCNTKLAGVVRVLSSFQPCAMPPGLRM